MCSRLSYASVHDVHRDRGPVSAQIFGLRADRQPKWILCSIRLVVPALEESMLLFYLVHFAGEGYSLDSGNPHISIVEDIIPRENHKM